MIWPAPRNSTAWYPKCSTRAPCSASTLPRKETVQNLLALRFANAMYEPIWNANYVDHVQITMAEDIGIGGRAGYYDASAPHATSSRTTLLQLML